MGEQKNAGQPERSTSARKAEEIAALEAMLTAARGRERDLTVELMRQRTAVTEYEARTSELGTIAARVAAAEEARRRAEAAATEHEQELAVARADAEASRAKAETVRARCTELEAELAAVSDDLAEATLARSDAARLQKERNEARARAHTERRLAAEDRIRAAEAEGRAAELQGRLRAAERRFADRLGEARPRLSDRSTPVARNEPGAPPRPDVIDLTEAEREVAQAEISRDDGREDEGPEGKPERPNDVHLDEDSWAASAPPEESRLRRLIHPRRRR